MATQVTKQLSHSNEYALNYGMARQAIINGNFDVWQRGTSIAVTQGVSQFQADRWFDFNDQDSGTLPTLTRTRQLQTAGALDGSYYFSRLATNGAGTSLGVNSQGIYNQRIENGVRNLCGNGKKVTLSFWARSDIANKRISPTIIQNYGSGGSPSTREFILGTPITLTSSWVKYTQTYTTNTLSGKTFGTANDDYIDVLIFYMWGTTIGNTSVQASVTAETFRGSGNIDIAQVQLCAGDTALPFQPKSYEEELRACQRYYYLMQPGFFAITGATDTSITMFVQTPIEMRASGVANWAAGSGGFTYSRAATKDLSAGSNVNTVKAGNQHTFNGTIVTGANTYCPGWIQTFISASISAEL